MAILLNGQKLSEKIFKELAPEISRINKRLSPGKIRLDIVMVGQNPASAVFVNKKQEAGARIGVDVHVHNFGEDIKTNKLRTEVSKISKNPKVHGVLVQLPLPPHINDQKILDAVPLEKDADVLGYKAAGKFYTNNKEFKIIPPTLGAMLRLLQEYGLEDFAGKNIVVVGAGRLVGRPAINYFMRKEASASAFNIRSRTSDKENALKTADIVISGAGKPGLITGDILKDGVIVIDAGSAKDPETRKLAGDVDFKSVEPKASYITPVPGGVGPMTVAMIFYNLVQLAKQKFNI